MNFVTDDILLRPAVDSDLNFLFRLHEEAIGPYLRSIWGWDERWQRIQFRRAFCPENLEIIQCQGVDVGFFEVRDAGESVYLTNIEILPEYQRRGIGSCLIQELLDKTFACGRPVTLQVFKINPMARALYERLGFRVTGENSHHHLMRAEPQERALEMGQPLMNANPSE